MSTRVLIVEDEEPLTLLLRYNLESEGYEVDAGAGRRGRYPPARAGARPRRARLDAARPLHRALPPIRTRRETERLPVIMLTARGEEGDRVADSAHRRRRLHRQAVLGAGAAGARPRPAPPSAHPRGDAARRGRHRARSRDAPRPPCRRTPSRPDRVPPARIPDAEPGRVFTREQRDGVGATTSISTSAPSTYMSAACERRSTGRAGPIPSAPCAVGYSFDETFARAERAVERRGSGHRSVAPRRRR